MKADWIDELVKAGDWIDPSMKNADWVEKPFTPEPEPQKKEKRDIMPDIERRVFATDEIRAEQGTSGDKHLTGYAIRFGRLSSILRSSRVGSFRERVLPGATRNI